MILLYCGILLTHYPPALLESKEMLEYYLDKVVMFTKFSETIKACFPNKSVQ